MSSDFAAGMEKLADYLEGLDNWIGDVVDAKLEYRAAVHEGRAVNETYVRLQST